jgi:tripartite-type tricarboxylate transporter receptor subunit TctC
MASAKRRSLIQASLLSAFGALVCVPFAAPQAQTAYPAKAITLVVPHAPGGSVDGVARNLALRLTEELKQNVVVENRPGASGIIGAASVARAEPDGYTLYFNASIHSINPLLYKSQMKFDAVKDFTTIGMVAQGALIFSVNPNLPAKTPAELVTAVKANPNKYSFVTSGFGSAGHLGIAQFMAETGISSLGVPIALYKGAGPALQDLIGGQVHAMMDPFLSSLPLVKAGKLRALAVTSKERSPLLPEVPTMIESGFKDFEFYSWYGVWAPARLPEPIRRTLEAATARAAADESFKSRLNPLGFEVAYRNGADFAKFIEVETARYKLIIEKADIKAE